MERWAQDKANPTQTPELPQNQRVRRSEKKEKHVWLGEVEQRAHHDDDAERGKTGEIIKDAGRRGTREIEEVPSSTSVHPSKSVSLPADSDLIISPINSPFISLRYQSTSK